VFAITIVAYIITGLALVSYLYKKDVYDFRRDINEAHWLIVLAVTWPVLIISWAAIFWLKWLNK
jgi:amino acid transporter